MPDWNWYIDAELFPLLLDNWRTFIQYRRIVVLSFYGRAMRQENKERAAAWTQVLTALASLELAESAAEGRD